MEEEAELKEKPIGSASLEESVVKAAPHKNGKTYASSENEVEKLLSLDDGPDDGNLISYDDEPPMANPYGRDYFDQYGAGADELLNFDESEFEARSNPVESPLGSEEFVTLDKPVDLITPVEEKPSVTTADYEEYDDKNWLKDKEENDHESEDTILAFGNELDDFAAAVARKALRASTNPTALPAQTFESLKRLSPSRSSPDKSVPTAGLRCYNRDEYEDEDRIVERHEPLTLTSSERPLRAQPVVKLPLDKDSPLDEDFFPLHHHDSHTSEEEARLKAQLLEKELEEEPGSAEIPTPPILIRPRPPTPPKQKSHDIEDEEEEEAEEVPVVLPLGPARKSRGSSRK